MGNCLRHGSSSSSSMQWGGDDWGTTSSLSRSGHHHEEEEAGQLLGDSSCDTKSGDGGGFTNSSTKKTTITEVKIKITKKQLEELLGRAELKELSVQQVVAHLMNVSDRYETHQRSWRPDLQSIPEVN